MYPVLFQIAGHPIHAYTALFALAAVLCTYLVMRAADRAGVAFPPYAAFWAFIGALLGGRIGHYLFVGDLHEIWRAFIVWEAGLFSYGAILGGIIAGGLSMYLGRTPLLRAADLIAPYLALCIAIIRLGCFLNGCCWGQPCAAPWAVEYPAFSPAHQWQVHLGEVAYNAKYALPVHPVQLYLAAGHLSTFALLIFLQRRRLFPGAITSLFLICFGALRFVTDFLRADEEVWLMGLRPTQYAALAMIIAGPLVYWTLRRRASRRSGAAAQSPGAVPNDESTSG